MPCARVAPYLLCSLLVGRRFVHRHSILGGRSKYRRIAFLYRGQDGSCVHLRHSPSHRSPFSDCGISCVRPCVPCRIFVPPVAISGILCVGAIAVIHINGLSCFFCASLPYLNPPFVISPILPDAYRPLSHHLLIFS